MKRINLIFTLLLCSYRRLVFEPGRKRQRKLDQILDNMQKAAARSRRFTPTESGEEDRANRRQTRISGGQIIFKHVGQRQRHGADQLQQARGQGRRVCRGQGNLYQAAINQAIVTTRAAAASKRDGVSFIATPYSSVPQLKSRYNIAYKGRWRDGDARADAENEVFCQS